MAKVSTLIDEFTGSSLNLTLWTPSSSTGPTSQIVVSGGNLTLGITPGHSTVTSKASYDWTNSSLVIKHVSGELVVKLSQTLTFEAAWGNVQLYNGGTSYFYLTHNPTTMKYFKFEGSATSTSVYWSTNNATWTLLGSASITPSTSHPVIIEGYDYGDDLVIASVNPMPNLPPSVEAVSPAESAIITTTTPALVFKGTDADAEAVTYQLQIARDESFTTPVVDVLSAGGAGFSGTNPYTSGANVTYTVQTPLLLGGLTYYWRVRSKDPLGTDTWGQWMTQSFITEPFAPQVTSTSTSAISVTTATASGNVTSDGGGAITQRGIVYGTSANPTTSGSKQTALGTTGAFSANLTGLTPSTLYHWRAYAINSKATSYGSGQTFTTLPGVATITGISSVVWNGASVAVSIPAGGTSINERGVVYSTVPAPTISGNKVIDSGSGGTFTAPLTGLTGNTTYYARAYATNDQGTSYSPESTFTTPEQPSVPTVSSGAASSIGTFTASFNGSNVTLDGTYTVTERGIVFSSTEDDPQITDTKIVASSAGLGTYNINLTGLEPETLYYVRAYATNSMGTGYGSVVAVKTLALFIPDSGDGYWAWQPTGSDAVVQRTQSTPAQSSANLLLSELNLEDGEQYTLYYSAIDNDEGNPRMVLQWFDNYVKQQQLITPGTPYTFTYDKSKLSWAIRLFVTGSSVESENINATFSNMYLAKESSFSGFVPFVGKGLTEIKLDNNWLLDKRREDTIQSIFDVIYGLGWREFNIKTVGLGWLEVGDQLTVVDGGVENTVIVWDSILTVAQGISETISADPPEKTETDYTKAGQTTKSIKRTQISVDHNIQEINSLVEDVYSVNGILNTRFSEIQQDIDGITTTVQSSGGVNLVKNSVMYSFSDDGFPDFWSVQGAGTLTIQASPESRAGGGISGNIFALNEKTVSQTVTVRRDVTFVEEADKMYYSFSARVKKNTVGNALITLSNRNETITYELPDQTEYFWDPIKIENLLPLDDHYTITIYSDTDANLQVTDVMLSPGKDIRQWTQANGEAMNTNVAITDQAMTIRSNIFRNDYVRIDALGFEVHKHEAGGERVFGFNGDETNVAKLRADKQISLSPMRMVPIDYDTYRGIAFTRTEDN